MEREPERMVPIWSCGKAHEIKMDFPPQGEAWHGKISL